MSLVGPAVLRPEHLRAMRRVLERELPSFSAPPPPEPLPIWVPPSFEPPIDPLPVWTPPADALPVPIDACPNCGEEVEITRIDLTANAGWLHCRACGLRWGGTIEREHGRAAAG